MTAMLKYSCLPRRFDPNLLKRDVENLLDVQWISHYQKRDFEGEWDVLALRTRGGEERAIYSVPGIDERRPEYADTPLLLRCPYIAECLAQLKCEKTTVRLMRLRANSVVKPHADTALAIEEGEARLHIPLVTNDLVEFYLQDEPLTMAEGDLWYLNLTLEHHLSNRSNADRIHLVVDCITNEWLLDLFRSPDATYRECEETVKRYSDEEAMLIVAQLRTLGTEVADRMAEELEQQYSKA